VNKTIVELDLRGRTGVTIIACVRDDKPRTNPPPDMKIEAGDILVLFGSHGHAELDAAVSALQSG
jgi:K+/H+ antiporter YhaU regulatory subunit KhtT